MGLGLLEQTGEQPIERPDREVMEKLFGKRVLKEVEKITKPVENKGD